MIVLHAASDGRGLYAWAEAGADSAADGTTRDGEAKGPVPESPDDGVGPRGAGDGAVRPWPRDAGPEGLAGALSRARGGFLPEQRRIRRRVAELPVRAGRPVPSTPMIADSSQGEEGPRSEAGDGEHGPKDAAPDSLEPHRVSALRLHPEEALTLLTAARGRRVLARGVIPAPDLRAWAAALRFALSLVARGRFLPSTSAGDHGRIDLRWEPALSGADAEEAARLAAEMPAAARCLRPEGASRRRDGDRDRDEGPDLERTLEAASRWPSGERADPVHLRRFLGWSVDYLVRSAQWEGFFPPEAADDGGFGAGDPARSSAESVHDRWRRALAAGRRELPGEENELEELAGALSSWRRPAAAEVEAPFRLFFRLREPDAVADVDEDDRSGVPAGEANDGEDAGTEDGPRAPGGWRLEALVQSRDDPSLRVPLERALELEGRRAEALGDPGGSGREHLYAALGRAAQLSPAASRLLEAGPTPGGAELDAGEAHRFLRRGAPALEEAGFGLLLPAWWAGGTRRRARARARVRSRKDGGESAGGLSLDELVTVDWELALGDRSLDRAELEALAELKAPLVRLRGEWVEVNPERLERIAGRLEGAGGEMPAREALRMSLGAAGAPEWAEEAGVDLGEVEADGRFGELVESLESGARLRELSAPEGLRGELRPYQRRGYAWLRFLARWGFGACLADDMGLGKTVQTLAAVQRDREEGGEGPVLVVCPTSVVNTWRREAERFTPGLELAVHHGGGRPEGEALAEAARGRDLIVTTYGILRRDVEDLRRVAWRGVVLDEAQKVKNPSTQRSRAARALEADWRVALTGTPVENHVGDLWALMEFLNPGLLGSQAEFRRRFFRPIQRGRDPEAAARLRRATGPFVLRREKSDPEVRGDLPEKVESKVWCTLTPEQATLYRAVLREAEDGITGEGSAGTEGGVARSGGDGGIGRKGRVLALLTRLKQVCNHPAQLVGDGSRLEGRSGKLERLTEMADELLGAGRRALIFTQYTQMGEMLVRHLQETFGRETLYLHGGVSRGRRDRIVDRFQEEDGPPFFVLSLRAGGTGLTLTSASHVIHYDRWWNPAVERQATDRAHRIGQAESVQVHKFVCAGTLEERIDELIESKKEVAEQVVGSGEGWLTRLSDAELEEIVSLDEAAVEEPGPAAASGEAA